MLLNKQGHCGELGGVGSVMSVSQSIQSRYTCLHEAHLEFSSIAFDRFSVDLDMSVKDRQEAESRPFWRKNETTLR